MLRLIGLPFFIRLRYWLWGEVMADIDIQGEHLLVLNHENKTKRRIGISALQGRLTEVNIRPICKRENGKCTICGGELLDSDLWCSNNHKVGEEYLWPELFNKNWFPSL